MSIRPTSPIADDSRGGGASGWLTKKRICNIPRMLGWRDGLQVRGLSTLLVIHYADLRVAF